MERTDAIHEVKAVRAEVVQLVGICGTGTHPLTDLLEQLEDGIIKPEFAVAQATRIRESVADFR